MASTLPSRIWFQPTYFVSQGSECAGDAKKMDHDSEGAIVFTYRPVESASHLRHVIMVSRPMRLLASCGGYQFHVVS